MWVIILIIVVMWFVSVITRQQYSATNREYNDRVNAWLDKEIAKIKEDE